MDIKESRDVSRHADVGLEDVGQSRSAIEGGHGMNKGWGAGAAIVVTGLVAGCGGGSSTATKTVTKTVTATATVTAAQAETSAATAASSTAHGALAVGKTASLQGAKVTVLHVGDKNAATDELIGSDQRFVGVEVRVCLADAGNVSYEPWRVLGSDGGEYEAIDVTPSPTDWPHPDYPYDVPDDPQRAAGSCITGWMMFGVNKSAKATKVVYRSDAGTAQWKTS